MLAELSIKNFAIIDELSVSFEKGLTVLTGETGAGKSIIIDAISLLVGGRGSSEFVRHGTDRAEIEGLFLFDEEQHPSHEKAKQVGLEVEDGMIVLRRDITTNGKSICRINGKLVTLAILREVGQTLIDIHGQHEHQDLMNQDRHLTLLDQYGGEKVEEALTEYREVFSRYTSLKKQLDQLTENEQQMAHRLDLIQFQLDEIKAANLQLNEDEELNEERLKISNFEKIYTSLNDAYNALHGEHQGLDWVSVAMNHTEDISSLEKNYAEISEIISSSFYQLEDASYKIRQQLDLLEFDPKRLDFIEARLNEINHLKRKYGQSVDEILEYAAQIEDEIDRIENRDTHVSKIKEELNSVAQDLLVEANNVSAIRKKLAQELTDSIHHELQELYMAKTVFQIKFSVVNAGKNDVELNGERIKFTKDGIDNVEFYISTNPGEPLKPLAKVASGGELSRIMLALKSIFSKHQGVTSIIFDEVDTGVSGRVAQSIGEKIHAISVDSQVLCISHLPQVAAMADTHLFIAKEIKGDRTTTSVLPLTLDEKVKEIGRMIAGAEITSLTKEHAKELLDLADKMKHTI
ncbi:DNA repair protein RecN [Priestia megaterium]|uniref:DNA repair protein RecN n=1 Tax=Priestia megaterium TaxID=1404 RepID=UPI002E1B0236|nr:DNA repair protein RecN [Priestia megaterium]MED4264479.1 DNA repair protein RecN [Priestia megaterium]MED4277819.1 DNA repair protein RecN [Priestia megaterium]MED4318090.1 DNA repair protein RecN [Priestia megaterium]